MPQSLHLVPVHIIFSTKNHRPFINPELKPKLHAYLAGILEKMGCKQITVGGVEDHVHILCNMTKLMADKDVLMGLKKDSSIWAKAHVSDFCRQDGYACFGVSGSHRDKVKQYILNQEEHHRTSSFKDELIRILDANGVEYDERYLWD